VSMGKRKASLVPRPDKKDNCLSVRAKKAGEKGEGGERGKAVWLSHGQIELKRGRQGRVTYIE